MNKKLFSLSGSVLLTAASLALVTTPSVASQLDPASQQKISQIPTEQPFSTIKSGIQVSQNTSVSFSDISSSYWAREFITQLAARDIIVGFPDGRFRPNEPVTRAQFAAMIRKAFNKNKVREAISFRDISTNYWASSAIREAYEMGFLNIVSGNEFNPNRRLSRLDTLVALTRGLDYSFSGSSESILQRYTDVAAIPSELRTVVAAATQLGLLVNYPNTKSLNLNAVATRAEVAAYIYQALVSTGEVAAISSPYIIGSTVSSQTEVTTEETTSGSVTQSEETTSGSVTQSEETTSGSVTQSEETTSGSVTQTGGASTTTQTGGASTTTQTGGASTTTQTGGASTTTQTGGASTTTQSGGASTTTQSGGGSSVTLTNGYRVTFVGVTYDESANTSTWRYRVEELPEAQDLSNWVLEVPSCTRVVSASPKGEIVNPDPNAKLSGIKWQPGGGFTDGEFAVTLEGQWTVGSINVAVKGPDVATGVVGGCSCTRR